VREGYLAETRVLPDGRALDVLRLTYGRARLVVSPREGCDWYDDGW
jgi:hypothetical protein